MEALADSSVEALTIASLEGLALVLDRASGEAPVQGVLEAFHVDLLTALQEVDLPMAPWAAAATAAGTALA